MIEDPNAWFTVGGMAFHTMSVIIGIIIGSMIS